MIKDHDSNIFGDDGSIHTKNGGENYASCAYDVIYRNERRFEQLIAKMVVWIKRIFHGVMVRIGKVEPSG